MSKKKRKSLLNHYNIIARERKDHFMRKRKCPAIEYLFCDIDVNPFKRKVNLKKKYHQQNVG